MAAVLGATGGLAALAETVSASAPLAIGRIAGTNRYATALEIAKATFGGSAHATPSMPTVILATGTNFPDALTASYLAGQMRTAILLTNPDTLSAVTRAGLASFGTKSVDLIGGPAAVSNSVVSSLTGMGISVKRIFNQDGCSTLCSRYDTMESVDTLPAMTPGTSTGPDSQSGLLAATGQRTAILATGSNFPDALAAGPLAVADHFPIILTAGSAATMSPQALAVIKADRITHLVVVGGAGAVNPEQYTALPGITVDTSATHGANRSQTSELLALDGVEHYGLSDSVVNIADGYDPSFTGANAQASGAGIEGQALGASVDLGAVSLGAGHPAGAPAAGVASAGAPAAGVASAGVASAGAPATGAPAAGVASAGVASANSDTVALSVSATTPAPGLVGFTPDALAGAVLGGIGAPLAPTLITDSPTNPGFVTNFVKTESASLVQGDVFGGTSAVSDSAMNQVLAAIPGATTDATAALSGATPALSTGPPALGPSGQPGASAATAVEMALAEQGVPYLYGGTTPAGFDCSGLVMYAWAAAGVSLAHNTVAQYEDSTSIPFADIAPGDIVFYDVSGEPDPGHEALYIGGGQVVVADTTGTLVRVQSLDADGTPMGYGQVG